MSEIHIVCPECDAHFKGSEELMYNPVVCGDCGFEFEVTNETIDKLASRHFPGERARDLEAFARMAPALEHQDEVSFSTASYEESVNPNDSIPMGPKRILAIFAGVGLSVSVLVLFLIGGTETGILSDVDDEKRWVLAGFSALVGGLLIIFGFRKYKLLGYSLSLGLMCGLCSMPFIYPYVPPHTISLEEINSSIPAESPEQALARYKRGLGYSIVGETIAQSTNPEGVVAIVLIDSSTAHIETIKKYLSKKLLTDSSPLVYPNRKIDEKEVTLLLFQGVKLPFDAIETNIVQLGRIRNVHSELQLIEVVVNEDKLKSADLEILSDSSQEAYYDANLDELKSLSETRQLLAVKRLATAEKMMRRSDIVEQLKKMLIDESQDHKAEIVNTLRRWSKDGDGVAEIVINQASGIMADEGEIPMSYLWYLAETPTPTTMEMLLYAWKRDILEHEAVLVIAGQLAEDALIEQLPTFDEKLLSSAASILRKIGTSASLPALRAAHEAASEDIQKSLKATIDEIESRE